MTTPDGVGFGEIPTVYQPAHTSTQWTGEWTVPTHSDPPTPRGTSVRPDAPPKGTPVPLATQSVVITRSTWSGGGKSKNLTETVTYPEGCTLHFTDGQQCLTIRDKSGQALAAFVGLKRYTTDLVKVTDLIVTESEGLS